MEKKSLKIVKGLDEVIPDLSKDPYVLEKMKKAEARLKNTHIPTTIKNRRK